MKGRTKNIIIILVSLAIIIIIGYMGYVNSHTITLYGNVEIQPVTGNVKVESSRDTAVVFIDVETGGTHTIPYITAGTSETIKLEKGKWYIVGTEGRFTMSLVNVRM